MRDEVGLFMCCMGIYFCCFSAIHCGVFLFGSYDVPRFVFFIYVSSFKSVGVGLQSDCFSNYRGLRSSITAHGSIVQPVGRIAVFLNGSFCSC